MLAACTSTSALSNKKTMQEIHLGNREQIHLRKALSNPFRIFFASIKQQHHIAYHQQKLHKNACNI